MKSKKLGGGGRFQSLKKKIESEGKSANAATHIAAAIGQKKYGAKMQKMAAAGRKRAARGR